MRVSTAESDLTLAHSAPAVPDVFEPDLNAALNGAVRDGLRTLTTALCLLYAICAVCHVALHPREVALPLGLLAGGTALLLLVLRLAMVRWTLPAAWAHPISAGMAGLVLLNSLLHLYLLSEPHVTMNVLMVVIGVGCFFLSTPWSAAVLTAAVTGWALVVWNAPPSPIWVPYTLTLLGATVLSVLVHTVRVRTFRRLEWMHIQDERRQLHLEAALQAMQQSEERFHRLSEVTFEGIVVHENGKVLYANRTLATMFGYDLADIVGRSVYDFVAPESQDFILRNISTNHEKPYEALGLRKDGSTFPIEISGNPIPFDGRTIRVVAVRDITDRKRIEQMKSDFVSLVSHQLKTPSAQINGYIENMLEGLTGDINPKQRQYLTEMREISTRNYRLISDLLNVSRIERGVISVDLRPASLRTVVDMALRGYRMAISDKGLALNLRGMDSDVVVLADADKLIEALVNVIDNSVKFTERGSITIAIKSQGDWGIIEVADTGVGMPPTILTTVFSREKVFSGEPIASGGAGLGLYIAKHFIQLQGGDVMVDSMVGAGSCFVFRIPKSRHEHEQ